MQKCHRRNAITAFCFFGLILSVSAVSFGDWGWGDYGAGTIENTARFDWSCVNYGNIPEDERTVERCNAILKINPQHKFLVRFWPIMSLGNLPNNRYQATLWDYFYRPGVKEKMQINIRRQFELLQHGLTHPESLVGMTFLEELPSHFTSSPFRRDIVQPFMPWDMEPFAKEIAAELGHAFDITQSNDAMWWGKKYCQLLNETHQYMHSLQPKAKILYWQATYYNTLDRKDKQLFKAGVLPIKLADLLQDGYCDGIFGYPNSEAVWQQQTLDLVNQYKCLFFSQVSTPAFMRLSNFENTVNMAQTKHPGNLGSFVYFGRDTNIYAWNMIPEFKGNNQVNMGELQRWFCDQYQVNNHIASQSLQAQLEVGYDFRDKKIGDFVTLAVVVYNPREKLGFGADAAEAEMQNLEINLAQIPDNYQLPPESNSPPRLRLGKLPGGEVMEILWWLQKVGDGNANPKQLRLELKAHNMPTVRWSGSEQLQQSRSRNERYTIRNSGESWLIVTGGQRQEPFYLELEPLLRDLNYPKIQINGQEIVYKNILAKGSKLRLTPGGQAQLIQQPLFSEEVLCFKHSDTVEASVFDQGYLVFSTPAVKVKAGSVYQLTITGYVKDDAILNVIGEFSGTIDGKVQKITVGRYNPLRKETMTAELTMPTPLFDPDSKIKAVIRFYRHQQKGSLVLQNFDFKSDEPLEMDVSAKMDGQLQLAGNSILLAHYQDRDEVNFSQNPLAEITIVNHSQKQKSQEERRGGADF